MSFIKFFSNLLDSLYFSAELNSAYESGATADQLKIKLLNKYK